jgi:uncharacterized protein YegL
MTTQTDSKSTAVETGLAPILPFYILGDSSGSMIGDPIAQVNGLVPDLLRSVITHPTLAEILRIGVIEFNSGANVLQPAVDVRSITTAPQFACNGSTNYVAAFKATRSQIDADLAAISAEGRKAYRPTVIMFTDGAPDAGDWKSAFAELVDKTPGRVHANVVPFGVANADKSVIAYMSRPQGYIMELGWDLAAALATMIPAIVQSIVVSGSAGGLTLPNTVPGFTTVNNDIVN